MHFTVVKYNKTFNQFSFVPIFPLKYTIVGMLWAILM